MKYVLYIIFMILWSLSASYAESQRFFVIELDGERATRYVRIDRSLGAVSTCQKQQDVWMCKTMTDKQVLANLEDQVRALEIRIHQLEHNAQNPPPSILWHAPHTMANKSVEKLFSIILRIKQDMNPPR